MKTFVRSGIIAIVTVLCGVSSLPAGGVLTSLILATHLSQRVEPEDSFLKLKKAQEERKRAETPAKPALRRVAAMPESPRSSASSITVEVGDCASRGEDMVVELGCCCVWREYDSLEAAARFYAERMCLEPRLLSVRRASSEDECEKLCALVYMRLHDVRSALADFRCNLTFREAEEDVVDERMPRPLTLCRGLASSSAELQAFKDAYASLSELYEGYLKHASQLGIGQVLIEAGTQSALIGNSCPECQGSRQNAGVECAWCGALLVSVARDFEKRRAMSDVLVWLERELDALKKIIEACAADAER